MKTSIFKKIAGFFVRKVTSEEPKTNWIQKTLFTWGNYRVRIRGLGFAFLILFITSQTVLLILGKITIELYTDNIFKMAELFGFK